MPGVRSLNFSTNFGRDCPFPVFLVVNELDPRSSWIRTIRVGPDPTWGRKLITALRQIPQSHIIYFQEDYFLTSRRGRKIDGGGPGICFRKRCRFLLVSRPIETREPNFEFINERFGVVPDDSDGRTRCQANLWKRECLLSVLREEESVWDFEAEASPRTRHLRILSYGTREGSPINYTMSAIVRGLWMPEALALCDEHGVETRPRLRGIYSDNQWQQRIRRALTRRRIETRAGQKPAGHHRSRCLTTFSRIMYGISRSAPAMPWRMNLSSRAAELSGATRSSFRFPKAAAPGSARFCPPITAARYDHPFTLDPPKTLDARIPRIIYSHDLFEHRTKGRWWDKIRGKYLVPAAELRRAKVLFLVRDPRDAFVSHYVQLSRPSADAPDQLKKMTPSEMLRDPLLGVGQIVQTMNDWLDRIPRSRKRDAGAL